MLQKTARTFALVAVTALVMAGCGGGDEDATPTAAGDETAGSEAGASERSGDSGESTDSADAGDQGASSGDGGGSVDLDGETIQLSSVRCHLESQTAAAGGGNILFVIQGEGEDSQGEPVMLDVSRYDDESAFAGDLVDVYVGDFPAGDYLQYTVMAPVGSVELDGSTATAEGLTLEDAENGTPKTASFTVDC